MAIDDNAASRNAVLDRVRSALAKHGPDAEARAAANAYLAARKQGPRPSLAGDAAAQFAARAQDMESSVERVATLLAPRLDDGAPAALHALLQQRRQRLLDRGIRKMVEENLHRQPYRS